MKLVFLFIKRKLCLFKYNNILDFYLKEKNEINVGFNLDFCFLNNIPIQITVNQIINNKMKKIKIIDFNHLLQQNKKSYAFVDLINNINFSSDNNMINDLKD